MIVKGQLEDAQLEFVADIAARDALTPKVARVVFVLSNQQLFVGTGSSWKSFQKESSLGDIRASMLTESDFQAENGSEWILADGRLVTGSDYHTVTGNTNVPDLRGEFLRGFDNGRGVDTGRSLGDFQDSQNKAHSHTQVAYENFGENPGFAAQTKWLNYPTAPEYIDNATRTVGREPLDTNTPLSTRGNPISSGGSEARPRNVTVNYFIKVYRDLGL